MNKLKYIEEVNTLKREFNHKEIEAILAYFYIKNNNISVTKSSLINNLVNSLDESKLTDITNQNNNIGKIKSIDELITGYEALFSKQDKTIHGIVFTPKKIKEFMINKILSDKSNVPKIIDPSCGCASFIITIAKELVKKYDISYKEVFEEYIYGIDINSDNLRRTEILIDLLVLRYGHDLPEKINLYQGNALDFDYSKISSDKFDIVIGNPPYVRAKNIDDEVKKTLEKWEVVVGNMDLYIVFFQLGCEIIKDDGIVCFITPNTYINSLNGRNLRKYLSDKNPNISIYDFKDKQIFGASLNYTCITIIDFLEKDRRINYLELDEFLKESIRSYYNFSDFDEYKPWILTSENKQIILDKINSKEISLGNYRIRNGLATLKNELYFFIPENEDENYYYRNYNGKEYQIEKQVCIDIVKPNIIKSELDLINNREVAIFPYKKDGSNEIIKEKEMELLYPKTYNLFQDNIAILKKRDKGNTSKYPEWYSYGRSQGLNNQGKKILLPYMANRGHAVLSLDEDLLFYCGYAIFEENIEILKILKMFIESVVFEFFIKTTSKPYAHGYVSLAKNYIKEFKIPKLTKKNNLYLLSTEDKNEVDKYICKLYGIDYKTIKNILE